MENFSPPAAESQLHFLDYWRIIRIRKTVIFAVFLLVVLTTTVVTYWLPRYYASTVRISVEKEASDISGLFEMRQNVSTYDPYWLQTQFEKIQSKTVLYEVITNLSLMTNWAAKYNAGIPLTPNEAYTVLRNHLDVRQSRNTSLIEIRFLSENPREAATIANAIAEAYRQTRSRQREVAAMGGIRVLEQQLEEQRKKVEEAQSNIAKLREEFQISDAVVDSGQANPLEPETVRRLEMERINAQRSYSQLNAGLTNLLALDRATLRKALPTAFPDPMLAQLLTDYSRVEQELTTLTRDYGAQNPDVQKAKDLLTTVDQQIEAKIAGILTGLDNKVKASQSDLEVATEALQKAQQQDLEKASRYGPYLLAKRDLDSQRQILHAMNMKIIAESVDVKMPSTSMVEIVDPAEPGLRPVRPNVPVNIALGVVVGLVVGIGLAFFIEYLDTSVKTIDDVERALQAPVLGVIPQNVGNLLDEGPDSPHAEAYRVLRTNLLFSRKDDRRNTLTVVSGGAGEGKSTTVFNLATVFAQNGQRVLIVDSDLRRPSLHKFLKVSNSIGLTNYLLKQNTLEEVVQTTGVPTMDFMPSGKLPSSSLGSILNSTRMREFITEVKQRYDFVFFDSPPIMGVSDASVLASEVDMAILVVQYRKYPQLMTMRAKQMVEKVGGNLMGVVLNNINISQDSYYYYYSGYYYDYYYSKRDEDGKSSSRRSRGKEKAKEPQEVA
ncbi:MAG TPA: polysaccharide biosynthesis tyrosine autokinase [Candidatus Paceibacterota bacterium]|nr:polysaccharide biosynthesis tyrosine autokinase [Verrucomicrobiota bacterium]HRZ43914.1 polysaccharide biosynthesis tyrosine autokinase [Candidatus Paceibacterota bacterium]